MSFDRKESSTNKYFRLNQIIGKSQDRLRVLKPKFKVMELL